MNTEMQCILAVLRFRAEQATADINILSEELAHRRQELLELAKTYEQHRVMLFTQEIQARNMDWCTQCGSTMYACYGAFFLVERREMRNGGEIRTFAELHRMCASCKQRAIEAGEQRTDSTPAKENPCVSAYPVELIDGVFYAHRDSELVRITPAHASLPLPSRELVDMHLKAWGLPPRLSYDFARDTLIFDE